MALSWLQAERLRIATEREANGYPPLPKQVDSPRHTAQFGPPHHCASCGAEVQVVNRSFGRTALEEVATGKKHVCAGSSVGDKLDAIIARLDKFTPPVARPKAAISHQPTSHSGTVKVVK